MLACEQAISRATEAEPLQGQARRKHKPYEKSVNERYETSGWAQNLLSILSQSEFTENLNYFGILTIFVAWFSSHLILLFWF